MMVCDALSRAAVQKHLCQRLFEALHDRHPDANNGKIESILAINEIAVIGAGLSLDELRNEQGMKDGDLEEYVHKKSMYYWMRMALWAYSRMRMCQFWCRNL